ncbi:hypothetical protein NU219Hw_g5768t1 [Hortaea werneckii]
MVDASLKAFAGAALAVFGSLLIGFLFRSDDSAQLLRPGGSYLGDDLLPSASMVFDQTRIIKASPTDIWPWIVQLGKRRGGWYCPQWVEKLLPASWRATRTIHPQWQSLAVGDRVEDYGLNGKEDFFVVAGVYPQKGLIYRSNRYGAAFSWALLLHELETTSRGTPQTLVHLRFRGQIAATGLKRFLIVKGGGVLDHLTTAPMLAGLAERVERSNS